MAFKPRTTRSVPFPFTEDLTGEMPKNFQSVMLDIENAEREALALGNAGGYHPWKEMVNTYRAANVFFIAPTTNYGNDYWQGGQFRRIGDMVEIRGLLTGGADNSTWSIMPPGFRPAADLLFPGFGGGFHARVDIDQAGNLTQRYGAGGGNSGFFTLSYMRYSLAAQFGEGFVQVGSGAPAAPFQNSWANFGATFNNAEYRLYGTDEVQVRGLVKTGANGTTVFTLPLGMRPYATMHFEADMNSAQQALIRVLPDGQVVAHGTNVGTYLGLNLAFSISGQGTNGWKPLTLQNGFVRYAADHPLPEYRITGDIVELRGLISKGGSAGAIIMASIPDRDGWPQERNLWGVHATGGVGRVDLMPDGTIQLTTGFGDYVSLNGLRFSTLP
jgi:hypothetical protein